MDLKKTKTDPKKELEGVWIHFDQDAEMKIARLRNPAALAAFQEKTRFVRGKLTAEKEAAVMTEILADFVLLDWKNITEGGVAVPYTKDNARRILTEFPAVRDFILEEAQRVENFLAEVTAEGVEAVKNG
jgi:hypothetical protein